MGRQPCCDKVAVKKGPWTAEEDKKLITFILNNGQCCWRIVPKLAGLRRCGKSCRLRWTNYLRPDLKRGLLSEAEEKIVIDVHARIGNKWSKIASRLPGRTDNDIKNHWNTHIKKKLVRMGIDPVTHQPLGNQTNETKDTTCSVVAEAKPEASTALVVQRQETRDIDSSSGRECCDSKEYEKITNCPLFEDTPLLDEDLYSWNVDSYTTWDACCDWLLDYPEVGFPDLMGLVENEQH